jgi:hypothetical protein
MTVELVKVMLPNLEICPVYGGKHYADLWYAWSTEPDILTTYQAGTNA